jgi:Protein of unknown function (DUF1553)/Protein of unknown function (DUF1549)
MMARRALVPACFVVLVALALGAGSDDRPSSGSDPFVKTGREWWAFQPVRRPEVPEVTGQGVRNPIDAFVRKAQGELGISPSAEADRYALIRRVTLDLTGLPPSPAAVESFVNDERADAYERVIDPLLASPAYGERWARLWLDLARYADSDGFEFDARRPNAWRYRDWVVNALNDDMPYDRFVRLQLAADELASDEPQNLAALGFLRNGPAVGNQKTEKLRMDELDDVVSTTSSVFLGLTVGCARCHDHKFDPIPTEDYYRLVAVFAPARFSEIPLASRDEQARYKQATQAVDERVDRLQSQVLAIERGVRARLDAQKRAGLPEAWRQALESGDTKSLSKDEEAALAKRIKIRPEEIDQELSALERSVRDEWRVRVAAVEATRPPELPRVPGVAESGARAGPVHLLVRGDVAQRGPVVQPGPLRAVAGDVFDFPEPSPRARSTFRRAALANWIVAAENPLTARVLANRVWQGHFGVGLVPTASDFGAMGEQPELPELLDWLAAEFVAQGWSQKALHRLIVTSATYRQASRVRPDMAALDPDNTLWWRFPLRRLDAEEIRDGILWTAGTLNPERGGPGVFPPIDPSIVHTGNVPRWPLNAHDGPEVWRRSLYVFQMRSVPVPLLEVFDLPASVQSCPRRALTTIPTQSLSLLNNPFVIDQSRRFAARVAREAGQETEAQIELAYRLAFGRPPKDPERRATREFLDRQTAWHAEHDPQSNTPRAPELEALGDVCQVLFNSNAFLYIE